MSGGMFSAAMRMCDDCSRDDRPLDWYGRHILICTSCRYRREETKRTEAGRAALQHGEHK